MKKPQPESNERQRAIDAFRLANGFVGDLVFGTRFFELYVNIILKHAEDKEEWRLFLCRMVYSCLVITLTKYLEWYARFKDLIHGESREGCKRLYVKLSEEFQIRKFRNKVVAHIIDDDTGKSLTPEEIDRLFNEFLDKVEEDLKNSMAPQGLEKIQEIPRELDVFCFWVNSQGVNPQDTLNTIEKARDAIKKKYNLTDDELFPSPLSS